MDNIEVIASEIWKELEEVSKVEAPLNIKPYYDEMVKKEDSLTKAFIDLKKTSKMTAKQVTSKKL
jgi:hypothetical protein